MFDVCLVPYTRGGGLLRVDFNALDTKTRHSAHLILCLQVKCLAANYVFQHGSQAKITGEDPICAAMEFVDENGSGRLGR